MKRFLKRFGDRLIGSIAGPDRILFRGTLQSISYEKGMGAFLGSQGLRDMDFTDWAQQVTQQIRQHAEALAKRSHRPYVYLESARTSKEETALRIMKEDGISEGLICVLGCVEPCRSFDVRRNRERRTAKLVRAERKCLHLYFYFQDREFGPMHVRLQTWAPFAMQVCLNGREWLARKMERAGIGFEQRDNCFARIDNVERAQAMFDSLSTRRWVSRLRAWAWRCNGWLHTTAARSLDPGYYWSARQDEYATDVMFRSEQELAELYPRLVAYAIQHLRSEDVLRFLGRRSVRTGQVCSHAGRRWEGVRVKHPVQENSIKMYDKQGSVLRVETTTNDPRRFRVRRRRRKGHSGWKWLPMRKGVVDLARRHELARAANARYLDSLSMVAETTPAHRLLDAVNRPRYRRGRRYRPLRPVDRFDSQMFSTMMRGEHLLHGFRNRDLWDCWNPPDPPNREQRRRLCNRAARWLALARAHGLIQRMPDTHTYRVTVKGQKVMTTALALRQANLSQLPACEEFC